jgi:hypothetical protein
VETVDWSVQRYDSQSKKLILILLVYIYYKYIMNPQTENPFYNARENRQACIILVIVIVFIGIMFLII